MAAESKLDPLKIRLQGNAEPMTAAAAANPASAVRAYIHLVMSGLHGCLGGLGERPSSL